MKRASQRLIGSGLAILALAACTKELPYKDTPVDVGVEVQDKSKLDTNTEYIYSSSMLNASRSSQDALPFSSGDTKRVKLEWTKDNLRVIEVERDARFRGNETNNKLVLELPVEHVDFHCAQDRYGECTNQAEENHDLTWEQKTKFKVKAESAKSGSLDLLPILIDKVEGGNCYEEVSARVLNFNLESSAVNIDIERTFKTNLECLSQLQNVSDATVSAVFHYSLVKANTVTSKDFKPIPYSTEDQNTFGFFTTERQELDTDNNATEATKVALMNHWNPNRKEIVYYLSDEFAKPENSVIKNLTYKTVDALNDGLGKAGARFHITLKEPDHKNPGDIRNSMIILVEDPVASSVIGYGPQTEDPATGEIFSARTVMFLGTIKKYISYTYDEILREKKREAQKKATEDKAGTGETKDGSKDNGGLIIEDGLRQRIAARKSQSLQIKPASQKPGVNGTSHLANVGGSGLQSAKDLAKEVKSYTKNRNNFYSGDVKAQFKYLQEAKNCSFGLNNADMISAGISPRLAEKFPADAKPWEQLSDKEKQDVINIILPEIWIPTLIHEMGHNLGLRHNFQGSEDKDNFYSDAELQALGIDHAIPFSTVMEYGDDLKALPVLGKYDIAALRYGYARKVELKDGTLVDLETSVADVKKTDAKAELKPYGYCTDEHTGINAGCRRFDLGTTYTDIVKNEIQSYLDRYNARNFRHGRANMSLFDDPAYAAGVSDRFEGLRLMQEVYERFKYRFNLADDSEYWTSVPVLADVKQASQLAGEFLLQVMQTPDLTCVVAKAETPTEIYDVIPLAKLDPEQISCFKAGISDKFKVIGQYGKSFNSKKDPESTNAYADQIDVRGYWIDKLMASRMLLKRNLGISTLDKDADNFMDRSDLKADIEKTVQDIVLNKVVGVQVIEMADGSFVAAELPVDTAETHVIEKLIHPALSKIMKIPDQAVNFSQVLASEAAENMVSAGRTASGRDFADSLKVIRVPVTENTKVPKGYQVIEMGNDRLIATPNNIVATKALQTRSLIVTLDKVKRERLVEIWKAKEDKKPAGEMTKEEKVAWDVDNETLKAYLLGSLGTADFYQNLVNVLPN